MIAFFKLYSLTPRYNRKHIRKTNWLLSRLQGDTKIANNRTDVCRGCEAILRYRPGVIMDKNNAHCVYDIRSGNGRKLVNGITCYAYAPPSTIIERKPSTITFSGETIGTIRAVGSGYRVSSKAKRRLKVSRRSTFDTRRFAFDGISSKKQTRNVQISCVLMPVLLHNKAILRCHDIEMV